MERRAILTQHPGQRRPAQPQPMLAREHRLQRQLPITEVQADLRGRRGSRNEASRDAEFASRTALTMRLQRIGGFCLQLGVPLAVNGLSRQLNNAAVGLAAGNHTDVVDLGDGGGALLWVAHEPPSSLREHA